MTQNSLLSKRLLIQTAKFVDRPQKKGLDSIIQLNYMGSAEFEWGSVPASLAEIRKNFSEYGIYANICTGENFTPVTVYCRGDHLLEVVDVINQLSLPLGKRDNNVRLKEFCDFEQTISVGRKDSQFWWDIGNHHMWWLSNPVFQEKLIQQIKTS